MLNFVKIFNYKNKSKKKIEIKFKKFVAYFKFNY